MAGEVFDIKKGKSRTLTLTPEFDGEPALGISPTFQTSRPDVIELTQHGPGHPQDADPFKVDVRVHAVENVVLHWTFTNVDGEAVSAPVGISGQPPAANTGSVSAGPEF